MNLEYFTKHNEPKKDMSVFKDVCWAASFMLIYLSVFFYLIIWLNRGFSAQHMIVESEKRNHENIEKYVDLRMKESIMPSAFKGRK